MDIIKVNYDIIKIAKSKQLMKKIKEAVQDIKDGKMVIVCDDESRENEGDFIMAAEKATPEDINFMVKNGGGLVCMPIKEKLAKKLNLHLMVEDSDNTECTKCKFTISVDAKNKTTTGISAKDRSKTINTILDDNSKPEDLSRPGHIFPLIAETGGVLTRAGHTEAATDLAKLAGFKEAGVICEILNTDGTMARRDDLEKIAKKYSIKIISIKDLIEYRLKNDSLIKKEASALLPTKYGNFELHVYRSIIDDKENLALIMGDVDTDDPIIVRVHSECLTGDALHSLRCDCGSQLDKALEIIAKEKRGVLLYMRQEGRGIGLMNKLKAYHLQDQGMDTVEANEALGFPADLRNYGIGAQILKTLGIKNIRLLTNNPKKIIGLEGYGLKITKQLPIQIKPNKNNKKYLETKKNKMGHDIQL